MPGRTPAGRAPSVHPKALEPSLERNAGRTCNSRFYCGHMLEKQKQKKAKKQAKHPDEMKSNDIFYLTNIISKSYHFDMQSA